MRCWVSSATAWAVVGISIVKVAPEEVVLSVKDVLHGECVGHKLLVALEERVFACSDCIAGDELALFLGILPGILDEFADALVTELFSGALLAVFVALAFAVQFVLKF